MTIDAAIRPSQPQSIGEVLDTTFRLYRLSIGQVWPLCLLMAVASSPTAIYMYMQGGQVEVTQADPFAAVAMFQNPTYWMMYLLSMALTLLAIAALNLKQNAIGSGEALSLGQALQTALGKILPLLALIILFGIAVMIGLVLLLIPGLILMVSLMLSVTIAVLEDRGPLPSLTESHRLIWGHWWRTSAILTVALVIIMVIYVAVGFLVAVIMPYMIGSGDTALFGLVTGLLVGVSANVLVTPFYIALLLAVYWDLKLRKQGGDLAARVGALDAA